MSKDAAWAARLELRIKDRLDREMEITPQGMGDDSQRFTNPCPKCKSTEVFRKVVLNEPRSFYLELDASCSRCCHIWCEIYEKGVLVATHDRTPRQEPSSDPITDVKKCPFCGKPSDSRTGFPFLFQTHRVRYHAHQDCQREFTARHGLFAQPPFGPTHDGR
jgi:hypothetical protein